MTDLYNRTYNAVYNTVRFMVKDEDAALDILQDSYIKAFGSLRQLQDAAKFEPWIKRIAHNKAIDYLRQARPVTEATRPEPETPLMPTAPTEPETPPTEPETPATEPEAPPTPIMPTEPETEMWGDEWIEAYQSVLNGYQDCMAAGPGGNSPYLYYECVRLALEAGDGSSRLVYGLYDVNSDGTPELVLAKEDLWFGRTITTDFEVYAFDGTGAVPLCREPLEEYEIPVIGDNGTIWSTVREGDATQVTFYELPYHGSELVETMHSGTMYSDTEYALFEKCRLKDAVITYYSILEPVQSSFYSLPAAAYSAEWLAHVKDQLGIPADLVTYDVIDWENPYYWEVVGIWIVNCEFYHDNELVACAMVEPDTGDLARNIMMYNGQ